MTEQVVELYNAWLVQIKVELMVCKAVVSQVIPAIKNDLIDIQLVYDRIELLRNTHSDESDISCEICSSTPSDDP